AVGGWVMGPDTLRGISPIQVKDLFALPAMNDYLTTVKVPAGTILRTGTAGPIAGWGDGGGQQILLISRLPIENYQQQRPLVEQNLFFSNLVYKGNPGNMAAYLDNLPPPEPFSDWGVVNLLLGYLPNTPLTRALNQIGPERYDTLTRIDIQNIAQFNSNLLGRRCTFQPLPFNSAKTEISAKGKPTGQGNPLSSESRQGDLSLWGKALGSWGRQDSSADHLGYAYQSGTILAGAEKKWGERLLIGSGIGLSRTGFSWDDNLGDGNMTQINLGLYGSASAPPYFVDAILSGGFRKAEVSRVIRFPGVDRRAASSPDGYNLAAGIDGGLNKRIDRWDIEPLVRMNLIYIRQNALSENGAESLNLNVDQITSWTWQGEFGVRVSRTDSLDQGLKITSALWLGFGYQTPLDNREIKASFIGQQGYFSVNGYSNTSCGFLPRLGIIAQGWGKTSLFLNYAGDYRSDFISHSLNAGLQVSF
ncbi:MAG TPA: autotransporter outer membrane beta-barrel domain-containing protein, partial [Thermodesulfobacteriota bacterium]|nr:autotransporter outer membrane beta-barrel domain-containing protein [Thermodesulfobacteriota bacterium]